MTIARYYQRVIRGLERENEKLRKRIRNLEDREKAWEDRVTRLENAVEALSGGELPP